ncbi:MAG: HAMP domain-containing sensor histidine kinase [Candidatus Binatia bacterium]|nr:HAMP domain-containing sensor histidine kinase [Candidatus Binatia bacterium]
MAIPDRAPASRSTVESAEGFCLAICHDLRGPLATAGAAMHELARRMDPHGTGTCDRYLEIARQSLSKADELLGALPGLVARRPTPRRAIALRNLIEAARTDVTLELELCGGAFRILGALPEVLGDPAQLRIALRNLVQNSIRHRRHGVAPDIAVRGWCLGDECTLTIADNGRGLPPSAEQRSCGLGIAIARHAIEASGGKLAFSSRSGPGTTAAVTLQAASAERFEGASRTDAEASRPSSD